MPLLANEVFDNGLSQLNVLTENLYINNAEPTTFTQASSTNKLGTKAAPTVGTPVDGDVDGRKAVVSAITDGTVDSSGTASHWSLTDNSASLLLAAGPLSASQAVTSGNTFSLDAINITFRDPTAV